MELKNKDLVLQTLERIECIHQMLDQLQNIVHFCSNRYESSNTGSELHTKLIEKELNEWRNLMMWCLTLTGDEQDRVKSAVYDRFLNDGMCVSHWLSSDGKTPSRWLLADEEEFRTMAKELFAPNQS